MFRTLRAWVELTRPFNAAMAALSVSLGGYLAAGAAAFEGEMGRDVALAALSVTLIGAGANALNDRLDVATDRINRPTRPIPSGRATERQAGGLWLVLSMLAVTLAAMVSTWHGAMAALGVVVLAVYSLGLKGTPLIGNAAVATAVGFSLLLGGEAAGGGQLAVLAAAFAVAVNAVREMVKDVEDVEGDRAAGLRTAPVRWGVRPVAMLSVAATAVILVALPIPVLAGWVRTAFLLPAVGAGVSLALAAAAMQPVSAPSSPARASAWLKGAMLFGMLALAVGV